MNQINHEGHEVHEGKYQDIRVLRGGNNIFSYDANGNRLTKVDQTAYQYDHNGNIINDGEHSYTYDARNHLVSIDNGTTRTKI